MNKTSSARSVLGLSLGALLTVAAACGSDGESAFNDGQGGSGGGGTIFDNQQARLSLGDLGSCLVGADGEMWCWGWNQNGQFLTTADTQFETPKNVGLSVKAMSLAGDFGCGILGGEVRCQGYDHGGTEGSFLVGASADGLATGHFHVCALVAGQVQCWGENSSGQLGDGTQQGGVDARPVVGISSAVAVDADGETTCAIDGAGAVWCWGSNVPGGDDPALEPVQIAGVSAKQIAVAPGVACAVSTGGDVLCWGNNCPGIDADCDVPTAVPGVTSVAQIAVGDSSACARFEDGRVACWGGNISGELGIGTLEPSLTPVELPELAGATDIAMGGSHVCALVGSDVYCWGANGNGQVGNGSTTDQLTPVKLSLDGGFAF